MFRLAVPPIVKSPAAEKFGAVREAQAAVDRRDRGKLGEDRIRAGQADRGMAGRQVRRRAQIERRVIRHIPRATRQGRSRDLADRAGDRERARLNVDRAGVIQTDAERCGARD